MKTGRFVEESPGRRRRKWAGWTAGVRDGQLPGTLIARRRLGIPKASFFVWMEYPHLSSVVRRALAPQQTQTLRCRRTGRAAEHWSPVFAKTGSP